MSTLRKLSSLLTAAVSLRYIVRWASGGSGILILTLSLHRSLSASAPIAILPYLFAGVAFIGFSIGIAAMEGCWWLYRTLIDRVPRATGADFTKDTSQRAVEPMGPSPLRSTTRKTTTQPAEMVVEGISVKQSLAGNTLPRRKGIAGYTIGFAVLFLLLFGLAIKFRQPITKMIAGNPLPVSIRKDNPPESPEDPVERAIGEKPLELRPALREYRKISIDVDRILRENWERKNLGGAVVLAVTNWQFNSGASFFKRPEELGFARISDPEALVNRAFNREILLETVEITPLSERNFKVVIKVTNQTATPLPCVIPKGQIIEIKNASLSDQGRMLGASGQKQYPQSVANKEEDRTITIPPRDSKTIEIIEFMAWCVNEGLSIPRGAGNLTVFAVTDKTFSTPDALHAYMRRVNSTRMESY